MASLPSMCSSMDVSPMMARKSSSRLGVRCIILCSKTVLFCSACMYESAGWWRSRLFSSRYACCMKAQSLSETPSAQRSDAVCIT